ncbi:hypothetical protein BJY59DRAFT_656445, partial [Rhodotorula toruloides]
PAASQSLGFPVITRRRKRFKARTGQAISEDAARRIWGERRIFIGVLQLSFLDTSRRPNASVSQCEHRGPDVEKSCLLDLPFSKPGVRSEWMPVTDEKRSYAKVLERKAR